MSEQPPSTLPVWDPLVRIFHWSLVLFYLIAYLTEDDFLALHVWAGYTVGLLIAFRLLWGLVGTRHARFSSFVTSPKTRQQRRWWLPCCSAWRPLYSVA